MSSFSGRFVLLLLLLLPAGRQCVEGQSRFDPRFYELASQISERLVVCTDRSLYIAGEEIHFRADRLMTGTESVHSWSSVVYAELIDAAGKTVETGKFPLREEFSAGSLRIPPGALTGSYYLKCYTRWMRNEGAGCFSYTGLKIIQPHRREVVRSGAGSPAARSTDSDFPVDTHSLKINAMPADTEGEMFIELTTQVNSDSGIRGSLTIIPMGADPGFYGSDLDHADIPGSGATLPVDQIRFLPDRGTGLSLTGSVVDENGELVPLLPLRFSLLGQRPDFFATVTDSRGRFAIQIPAREGNMELFVSPREDPEVKLQVRIDQDFDLSPPDAAPAPFILPDSLRKLAGRMALNLQLAEAFRSGGEPGDSADHSEDPAFFGNDSSRFPFYGSPMFSLDMDDYVELPLLEEVFINLVPMVQVVSRRRQTRLEILSENPAMDYYSPLLLVDHIPVQDHEDVLRLPPREIRRIDVIHDVYVKGSLAFGGVISIFSRNGDMAGIDLPRGAYFFDFTGFSPGQASEVAASSSPTSAPGNGSRIPDGGNGSRLQDDGNGSRIPDTRNTILWVPDLSPHKQVVAFNAPAKKGVYVALFRGVDRNGRLYEARSRFRAGN